MTDISGIDNKIIQIGYDTQLYYIKNNIRTNINSFPINISNTGVQNNYLIIQIINDISVNNSNLYFNLKTDYIEIDGQNHTFTINSSVSNYAGLISYDSTNTGQNILINNIHVDGRNSNLISGGGDRTSKF